MAKTIELSAVPDELHDALAARAGKEGISIPDELLARLRRIPPLDLANLTSAHVVREGREERTDNILDAVRRR
ncbi:MAG TPA: hypothetical protein VGF28_06670 [Thermoanaerobaculia bacterium]|jgi:hypothetical protein